MTSPAIWRAGWCRVEAPNWGARLSVMTRIALLLSHGQPSDPDPAEAALALLAAQVRGHLPGWQVVSATLAKPGALEAVAGGTPGWVYPMFMAGGWFTVTELPRRMKAAGGGDWAYLPPFGLDGGVQDLGLTMVRAAAAGRPLGETSVLLAAHGSFRSPAPSDVANAFARRILAAGFGRAEAFFIDQAPRIATARGFGAASICLPFFAAEGWHVVEDLPGALAAAGFQGDILPPLGLDPRVPGLIARALRVAAAG